MNPNPPDEIDVLVIGFGAASASAAIAAHDAGAAVAVVEKTSSGGGNCIHSGGFLFEVHGPHAVDHLDALCFGKTDRTVLEAYARGLRDVAEFIETLGGTASPVDFDAFGGMLPSWPHFPGAGSIRYRQFVPEPGERPGVGLWRVLEQGVRERHIQVVFGCPAVDLIIDGDRVSGAIVERDGERVRIEARNGVILASGGFEADAELRDTYLPLPLAPVGHQGNTGDTLRLARGAGASLWHMGAFFGWLSFVHPDFPAAFTLDVYAPSFICVDGDGRRFADETGWEVHDRVRALTAYLPRRRNRPRMPGWIIFDETARLAGPLHGIVGSPNDYAWSPDNSAEVATGWIARGEDTGELAAATGLDPAILRSTLGSYADAVSRGQDDDFGRARATLVPLIGPLYAIRMTPGVATASGGPRRDAQARVVAPGGEPIPGLFAAGGAGSIWGHLTEHGGGLTDAIVFGRIAGSQCASADLTVKPSVNQGDAMSQTTVDVTTSRGTMPTYVYRPDGDGPFPRVLLYMDAPGIRPALLSYAERLAGAGYTAIVPDLYYALDPTDKPSAERLAAGDPEEFERMHKAVAQVDDHAVLDDTRLALDAVPDRDGGEWACIGFCMGGRLGLRAAEAFGTGIAAASLLHPARLVTDEPDSPHLDVERVDASLYFGFGENDSVTPLSTIPPLRDRLENAGVAHRIEILTGAEHGFMMPGRAAYNEAAAERAWAETLALLAERL